MNLKLRPYQEECLKAIQDHSEKGVKRQLISMATGSGKTVVFGHLIDSLKCKSLVIAHTNELLGQSIEKIKMVSPSLDVGLVNASKKEFHQPVIVSSIQSARQPETLKQLQRQNFDLLVYDEAHHASSDSSRSVLEALGFGKGTKKLLCGFTATPMRSDGNGLGEDFDKIVYSKPIKSMIEDGYLCLPVGIKIATDLDLSNIDLDKSGDYKTASLTDVMDTREINELVVKTYQEKAQGRKTICFCVSIAHAEHLAQIFQNNGIKAESVSGNMPLSERNEILQQFKDGKIEVITNCQILTEGFDCPDVDCVIIARPTQSQGLYIQMAGRGLRLYPNKKDCIILDFGDKSHSLCNTNVLIGDAEAVEHKERNCERILLLALGLPPTINQKLKSAIFECNLLGDDFLWQKDTAGSYQLKGAGKKLLKIVASGQGQFDVIFLDGNIIQTISEKLSFEYAFASAEGFAKDNRSHFIVSDMDASWRDFPISDKQKDLFRSFGYRSGIEELSRGQASLIISSGVLNRKAARR